MTSRYFITAVVFPSQPSFTGPRKMELSHLPRVWKATNSRLGPNLL